MTAKTRAELKSDVSGTLETGGLNTIAEIRTVFDNVIDSAVFPDDLDDVATSGDYDDLINAPTLGSVVSDTAYDATSWDSVTGVAPSKNAVRDKVVSMQTDIDAKVPGTRTITAGTGLTGGGDLTSNRTVALSAGSIASLALADSATQPEDLATVATTGSFQDLTDSPISDTAYGVGWNGDLGTPTKNVIYDKLEALDAAKADDGHTHVLADITDYDVADYVVPSDNFSIFTNVDNTVATPSDGDILVYRVAGSDWVLETKPATSADPSWGSIIGTLGDQTDLQTALDAKTNTTRSVNAGTGLTGGGTLAADRTIALSAGSIASLALADTALQPASGFEAFTDVDDSVATPADGDILVYRSAGTDWVLEAKPNPTAVVSDTAYDATSWNSVVDAAPSKNAVRDKIEALDTAKVTKPTRRATTSASVDLLTTDNGNHLRLTGGGAQTVFIEAQVDEAFSNEHYTLIGGVNNWTLTAESGVSINAQTASSWTVQAQPGCVLVWRTASDTWIAYGDMEMI